jgi:hypothetical protein
MNAYITDQIAREHTERLLSDAAASRRVRRALKSRRTAGTSTRSSRSQPAARPGAVAAAH